MVEKVSLIKWDIALIVIPNMHPNILIECFFTIFAKGKLLKITLYGKRKMNRHVFPFHRDKYNWEEVKSFSYGKCLQKFEELFANDDFPGTVAIRNE